MKTKTIKLVLTLSMLTIAHAKAQDPINSDQTANHMPNNYRSENLTENYNEAIIYPNNMFGTVTYPSNAYPASKISLDADGSVYFIGQDYKLYSYTWDNNTAWNLGAGCPSQWANMNPAGGLLFNSYKIYAIGNDGKVYNFYKVGSAWYLGCLVPSQSILMDARAGLTADAAGNIYGVGTNGYAYVFSYSGGGWSYAQVSAQFALVDPRGKLTYEPATGKIYCICTDGRVYNYYKVGGAWSFSWLRPSQYQLINPAGGLVISESKVFGIGNDGKVYNFYWDSGANAWQFNWLNPSQYATISAVGGLTVDQNKIYCIGTDGKVYNYYWDQSAGAWQFNWLNPSQYATINPYGKLTIDHGKVYCIGTDGKVYNYYWDPTANAWQFNWLNSQQKMVAYPASGLAVNDRVVYFAGNSAYFADNHLGALYYKAQTLNYAEWGTPVFNEEFMYKGTGAPAFSSNWLPQYTWGHSNNTAYQWEYSSLSSLSIIPNPANSADRMLRITANNVPVWAKFDDNQDNNVVLADGQQNYRQFNYTSGTITSNQTFQYGLFEIRAKYPSGTGFWPAFWVLGFNPWYHEMDILECHGSAPYENSNNVIWHRGDNPSVGANAYMEYKGPVSYTNAFHTFSMIWTPTYITFYVDGIELRTVDHHVPQEPMNIIANLAIGLQTPDANTVFPNYMDIDYIRVYQKASYDGPKNLALANNTATYNEAVIYPNPSNGAFTINPGTTDETLIEVFDMQGKKVKSTQVTGNYTLDLTGYPKGIYMVKMTANGQQINKKIILE